MGQLPKGYYGVSSNYEEDAINRTFTYRGVTYDVDSGRDLFQSIYQAIEYAHEAPKVVLEGLPYDHFDAPVILFNGGHFTVDRFTFRKSLVLLGENVGVDPNLPSEDGISRPALNPARKENESLIYGTYWFGHMSIEDPSIETVLIDGFTCRDVRIRDIRTDGKKASFTFKNIIHEGPCGRNLYDFAPIRKGSSLDRRINIENCRLTDFDDFDYGAAFIQGHGTEINIDGLCYDSTSQIFGFSNMTHRFPSYDTNAPISRISIKNSYFGHMSGDHGISTGCYGIGDKALELNIENCTFVDACRPTDSPILCHLVNDGCSLNVKDCRFRDSRDLNKPAVSYYGEGKGLNVENCTFEGYSALVGQVPPVPVDAPEYIDGTLGTTDTEDAHEVIKGDLSALDALYEGTKAYYGDLHTHTACGGTSDGGFPMKDWPERMDKLDLDFAAVVDHRQMRGFFLPEWDEERFIIGTEPAGLITDSLACLPGAYSNELHYNMLFPHRYGLSMVMASFPEFKFRGDELNGSYVYPRFTRQRFGELVKYVQSLGGMFVHPHPKVMLASSDPLDFYYGEHMYLETLYNTYDSHASFKNYALWVDLLNMGKRVYTSSGSDTHSDPTNRLVATFYTKEKNGRAFFDKMHSADYAVGAIGMKMCIDGHPMGSEIEYKDGMTLSIRLNDFYKHELKDGTAYELRIYTDKGLAYASMFNGKKPQELSIAVQKRMYYRAEVFDMTHGYRVSIGNPIWLNY